jgi:hypothetical protein
LCLGCLKEEEVVNRNAELSREHLQVFKRWSVDPSLDQAQEIHRNTEQFREFLLAHSSCQANTLESIAEFVAETRQEFHLSADSRLHVIRLPPNGITGFTGIENFKKKYGRIVARGKNLKYKGRV